MNTFELNKIAGAVLGSLLVILGVNKITGAVYGSPAEAEAKPQVVAAVATTPQPQAAAPEKPFSELLAAASPDAGKRVSAKCVACHSFEQGGAHKTGPNLWGVVGQPFAAKQGFNYSPVFQSARTAGRVWTDELIAQYLENPRTFLPGNKMSFAGLKKPDERASMIAYLHQQSNVPPRSSATPVPAPAPQ